MIESGVEKSQVRAGLLRIAVAGAALLVVASGQIEAGWAAYLAVGLAVVFGGLAAFGWLPGRARNFYVLVDALAVSLLVWGTGGEGSMLWPLYFLAAAGIAWAPGRGGARAGAVSGAVAAVGGYLVVVLASGAEAVDLRVWMEAAVILLVCGVAGALREETGRLRREREQVRLDLAAEREYREQVEDVVSRLGPLLGMLSLEGILEWAAGAARGISGAEYAHAVIMDGNHHRTSAGDGHDSYPSWWHPEVQRLALWSYRENEARRSEADIRGMEGLVAVPVVSEGGEPWGALVAGGGAFGVAEERTLGLLADRMASALEKAAEAPGGRDIVSGLPSRASFERMLGRELSRGAVVTVVAADLDGLRRYNKAYSTAAGDTLLREIGRRFAEGSIPAFRCGGDEFALVLKGGSHTKARSAALRVRRIVSELTTGTAAPLTVSTGFTVAGSGESCSEGGPGLLLDAALLAVSRTKQKARATGESITVEPVYQPVGDLLEGVGKDAGMLEQTPGIALSLVEAAEARLPALGAHLRAVSRLSGLMGAAMGFSREDLDALIVGGLLHDVGKIGISDSILLKTGPLSAEEYKIMKHHPVMGGKMVERVPELNPALSIVMYHHERFDGLGYPAGLAGEEIPFAARIVAVADAFDSMVRNRPYRQRLTTSDALEEVLRYSGAQFDPQAAEALGRVIEKGDLRIAN